MTSLFISGRKSALLGFSAIVCLLLTAGINSAQAQDFEVPQPTGNAVNDFAGVIDPATRKTLEDTLINLKNQQKIEFAVVTVKTTGGRDIFDYGLAVARRWGIGPASDEKQGLLLLVAIDDKKYQTFVSRHLQGELTDGVVGSFQRQYLVPAFRAGNYGKGLADTVRAYIDTLASKRGFSTAGIYQEPASTRTPPPRRTKTGGGFSVCGVIAIIIVIIIFLMASRGRGGGGGCLNALLLGSLLGNLTRGGSSSGGWSGGGFGGSSGGSGGGFGGFGGGGDFDGGGAGGSW